jgi:hypothetical protein
MSHCMTLSEGAAPMNRKPATRPGTDPMIHDDQRSLQFHSPSPAALLDNALLKRQSLLGDLK